MTQTLWHQLGVSRAYEFSWASLERQFNTRLSAPPTDDEVLTQSCSLLLLALYFDKVIIDPGFFFAAFADWQHQVVPRLLLTRIAEVLASEGILVTYGDRGIPSASHARVMRGTYLSRGMFNIGALGDQHAACYGRLGVWRRETDIVELNKQSRTEMLALSRSLRGYVNREADLVDQAIDLSGGRSEEFDHQAFLWMLATGRLPGPPGAEKVFGELLRRHKQIKERGAPKIHRVDTEDRRGLCTDASATVYSSPVFSPILLEQLLDDAIGRAGGTRLTMRSMDGAQISELLSTARRCGFPDEYHQFLQAVIKTVPSESLELAVGKFRAGAGDTLGKVTTSAIGASEEVVRQVGGLAIDPATQIALKVGQALLPSRFKGMFGRVASDFSHPKFAIVARHIRTIGRAVLAGESRK